MVVRNDHQRMKQHIQETYVDTYEDEEESMDYKSSDLGTVEDYLKSDNEFSESRVLSEENQDSSTTDHSASALSSTHVTYAGSTDGNTLNFAVLVILTWLVAIMTFLYVGINSELGDTQRRFERIGEVFVIDIEESLREYENAGRWVFFHCHEQQHTHDSFNDMYNYMNQGLAEVLSMAWLINVSHAERSSVEDESRAFVNVSLPDIPYVGIFQYDANPNYNASDPQSPEVIKNRVEDKPWYFILHQLAPRSQVASLLDASVYNEQWSADIDEALRTSKPVLTKPLENPITDVNGINFFANLIHPGIGSLDDHSDEVHETGMSWITVTIPSIVIAVSERHVEDNHNVALYIFDSTDQQDGGEPYLIGGSELRHSSFALLNSTEANIEEIELENRFRFEAELNFAGRQFTVLLVPLGDFYDPDLSFILFGGGLTIFGTFFLILWLYHNCRRGQKLQVLMARAKAENFIVASLFPSAVHSRLIAETAEQQQQQQKQEREEKKAAFQKSKKVEFQEESSTNLFSIREKIMAGGDASVNIFGSKPIADLFPDATIMFADLVGFTAWSSVREPAQVFTLLETIYHAFDTIAKKRRIFKVETVGDCYVAVAGLPQPRKDHAVAMARFATDCRNEMQDLVKSLETVLGPDTGDLNLRVGLHSGEVTAGVLRGDKGRFQLFGDTMNTASRMESTGLPGEIQVSESTAHILKAFKKGRWLRQREDKIVAKGKGELSTFWLDLSIDRRTVSELSVSSKASSFGEEKKDEGETSLHMADTSTPATAVEDEKTKRLIAWNVEVLAVLLKKIIARRQAMGKLHRTVKTKKSERSLEAGRMPLDEVQDIIILPEFNDKIQMNQADGNSVELGEEVMSQLHDYVRVIASLYHHNPFHNFEHASHVIMSVTKLLSRIIEPSEMVRKEENQGDADHDLHDYTFGITSDPLTQFACALSALIHDVDHPGVPNTTLVREESFMAKAFNNKSVAEQNSVEIGWLLLMGKEYRDLQECIYCDQEEFDRFRQLVVNVVMATDVMDKALGEQRKARWNKAFSASDTLEESSPLEDKNRKATIVIEHIIQASDIAHTMQHWHIYAKWNERLFAEMYRAYEAGRLATDPSTAWYAGEKGFFDFYVIPLAKKLDTCGVFGASSHEYHNYAVRNREEWESKGEDMVAHYLEKYKAASKLDVSERREYGSIRGRQNVERYLSKLSLDDLDVVSEFSDTSSSSSGQESVSEEISL